MRFLGVLFVLLNLVFGAFSADIDTLNYALTLEHLEVAFYTAAVAAFPTATSYTNAGFAASVFTYVNLILAHETAHVNTLTTVITNLGGTPVAACATYNFNSIVLFGATNPTNLLASVTTFLSTAAQVEALGVSAYDGAINTLSNKDLITAAATIATIEARHAQYLATVVAGAPPTGAADPAFDTANGPGYVGQAAGAFLTGGCPALNFISNIVPRPPAPINLQVNPSNPAISVSQNDLDVAQYALTLENLENAFYTLYIGTAAAPGVFGTAASFANYPAGTLAFFQLIQAHEASHVAALSGVINGAAPGTAVQPCTYTFGKNTFATVDQFVSAAASIEQVGVSAYDGIVNGLTDTNLAQIGATIATVEARHSEFLNSIQFFRNPTAANIPSALPPAGTAFDPALLPTAVLPIALSFIAACPANQPTFALPVFAQLTGATAFPLTLNGGTGATPKLGAANTISINVVSITFVFFFAIIAQLINRF